MSIMSRLDAHAELVARMADALGVDFEEEMMRGALAPEEFRSYVLRCAGCRGADSCSHWLETEGAAAPASTPDYCRNRDQFAGLMR